MLSCNLMDLFLNPFYYLKGFTLAILQALGKLPNVMERLHNSLIGFAKIRAPFFKNFPEIFVNSCYFCDLHIFQYIKHITLRY